MIRFIKSIPFHFKSALHGLRRHVAMTFSAASAVAVTMILMSLFLLLTGNITSFTSHIEQDFKIHVSIDMVKTNDEIKKLQADIEKMSGVKSVSFSSKDEELEKLIAKRPGMFESSRGEANPMYNVFIIEVDNPESVTTVTNLLTDMDGVEKAQYGGEAIDDMINAFMALRNGGAIFVLALGALAIFLISNTIKMTIYARNQEISIMRNVGAANWFIKTPFVMEGMFIGFIGAAVPALITYVGYKMLYDGLGGLFFSSMFVMQPVAPFIYYICGILILSGMVVGIVGSSMAVSKYLRWKR